MKLTLTRADYERAAAALRCEPEAVEAVAIVESNGRSPFFADGFPVILYERHIFYKALPTEEAKQLAREHPDICWPKGYGRGNYGDYENQRIRFNKAFALNAEAAMQACSWGAFQELGINYAAYGFRTVGDFVDQMKSGVDGQLDIFIKGIQKRGLADELRRHDWATFARIYNGPGYRKFNYDTQIAAAYAKAKRRSKSAAATPTAANNDQPEPVILADDPRLPSVSTDPQTPPPTQTETKEVNAPPKDGSTETAAKMTIAGYIVPPFLVGILSAIQSAITNGYVSAADVGAAVIGFAKENTKYVFWLIGLIIVAMALKKLWKQITLWKQMEIAADPTKHDVEVKPQ